MRLESIETIGRRTFLKASAALAIGGVAGCRSSMNRTSSEAIQPSAANVQTVLGLVPPDQLGVTLMHEHAPTVDWSELYELPPAPVAPIQESMLELVTRQLGAFHQTLSDEAGPGAIVECTPIRVGRYPRLLVELARRTPVHIIACTGFWCEALAPQHPWALRLGLAKNGVRKMADLYIREISIGMEDPAGRWGERFTDIRAGVIKCATSAHLRPSERRCHEAAAIASRETGCPITTHTTEGGGLEESQLLLRHGVTPEKIIIGHQGHLDDRKNEEAHDYHRRIADLGCYVQFDRVGHAEKYDNAKIVRQIDALVGGGYTRQILLGHDRVPYFYNDYTAAEKNLQGWKVEESDFKVVTTTLSDAIRQAGMSRSTIHAILVSNPARALAF